MMWSNGKSPNWHCPSIRSTAWFYVPLFIMFVVNGLYCGGVMYGMEKTYHPPEIRNTYWLGEVFSLVLAVIIWGWFIYKYHVRKTRYDLVLDTLSQISSTMTCMNNFITASSFTGKNVTVFVGGKSLIIANTVFTSNFMGGLCASAQMLLAEVSELEIPTEACRQITANMCEEISTSFYKMAVENKSGNRSSGGGTWKPMCKGMTEALLLMLGSVAPITDMQGMKDRLSNSLTSASKKQTRLLYSYMHGNSTALDYLFLVIVFLYLVSMPFLLWCSEGYWGIGTDLFFYITAVTPFAYTWYVEDIFRRPSPYYAAAVYHILYDLHRECGSTFEKSEYFTEKLHQNFSTLTY